MSEKYKKACRALVVVSPASGCVSISAFASLVGVL